MDHNASGHMYEGTFAKDSTDATVHTYVWSEG